MDVVFLPGSRGSVSIRKVLFFWMIQLVGCLPAVSSRNFSSSSSSHSRAGCAAAVSFVGTFVFETRIILGLATRFLNSSLRAITCSSNSLIRMVNNLFFPLQPASLACKVVEIPHTSVSSFVCCQGRIHSTSVGVIVMGCHHVIPH